MQQGLLKHIHAVVTDYSSLYPLSVTASPHFFGWLVLFQVSQAGSFKVSPAETSRAPSQDTAMINAASPLLTLINTTSFMEEQGTLW